MVWNMGKLGADNWLLSDLHSNWGILVCYFRRQRVSKGLGWAGARWVLVPRTYINVTRP